MFHRKTKTWYKSTGEKYDKYSFTVLTTLMLFSDYKSLFWCNISRKRNSLFKDMDLLVMDNEVSWKN